LGTNAGASNQGNSAVAVGNSAGTTNQGNLAIAVGSNSGSNGQGTLAIAIGNSAGANLQGTNAVSIGSNTGFTNQGSNAVALGANAGSNNQGVNSVAIGAGAGSNSQGGNSIAIGYGAGANSQSTYSTILNASGANLDSTTPGFFVNPVRFDGNVTQSVYYNTVTSEFTYNAPQRVATFTGNAASTFDVATQAQITGAIAPSPTPKNGDLFIDTNTGTNNQQPVYIYVNGQWRQMMTVVNL
jgi:hypothetical protein